jgi:hypothetical protein
MPTKTKKKYSIGKGVRDFGLSSGGFDILVNKGQGISEFAQALLPFMFKDGGRVRGVGKATHGYGKAMKKQGKK